MPKRVLQGVVVSDKNAKAVVVEVERRYTHPAMRKTVRRARRGPHARREPHVQGRRSTVSIVRKCRSGFEALDCGQRNGSVAGACCVRCPAKIRRDV